MANLDRTGICRDCKEWTTLADPCCGAPVLVDGGWVDPEPPETRMPPYPVRWRNTGEGGAMLSTSRWWIGAVGPSTMHPGEWHWKVADVGGDHYCLTRDEAIAACEAAVLARREHRRGYVLVGGRP